MAEFNLRFKRDATLAHQYRAINRPRAREGLEDEFKPEVRQFRPSAYTDKVYGFEDGKFYVGGIQDGADLQAILDMNERDRSMNRLLPAPKGDSPKVQNTRHVGRVPVTVWQNWEKEWKMKELSPGEQQQDLMMKLNKMHKFKLIDTELSLPRALLERI